jgi:uncharacterized membrane protein
MRKLLSDNASECIRILLNALGTRFTQRTISYLKNHPDYPNLLSLSHTLDQLGIECVAVRTAYSELRDEIPKPALVHLYDNGGIFLVVTNINDEGVQFINEHDEIELQPRASFEQSWSGVAVVLDNSKQKDEGKYAVNLVANFLAKSRVWILATAAVISLYFGLQSNGGFPAISVILFLLTKLIGVVATVPLLIELVDKNNPVIKKLCVSNNPLSKVNCSSILDSKGAKFLGLFSWSALGFVYFVSQLLYLVLFPVHNSAILMSWTAIFAFPYVGYSLWYQSQVIKRWCRLCLYVQTVLIIECGFGLYILTGSGAATPAVGYFALECSIIASIFAIVFPILSEWHSGKDSTASLRRLKADIEIFNLLLARQRKVPSFPKDALMYKSADSTNELVIISNPTCAQCIHSHRALKSLVDGRANISVREILLVEEDKTHPSNAIAELMIDVFAQCPREEALACLEDYYSNYVYDHQTWIAKYAPRVKASGQARTVLMSHVQWCIHYQLLSTPIVFVNGHQLPPAYALSDLKYLFD